MIQETIHKLEVAGGTRYLKIGLSVLLVVVVTALYNLRVYRNFGNQESMDAGQLARNIAHGQGYTTDFIRPFSMYLIRKNNEHTAADARLGDLTRIRGPHPDIANPPVYPAVLAALMKVLPFNFSMPLNKGFWSFSGIFWRSQPDFLISFFNQVLFLLSAIVLLFLARRLFDPITAWTSAALFFGTELFCRAYRLLMEVIGPAAALKRGSPEAILQGRLERAYQGTLILTFGGGTNEVQRDLISAFGLEMAVRR